MTQIQTFSGGFIDLLDPDSLDIHIEDIAHALSNICRFGGHVRKFYSVAQHSVFVSFLVPPGDALHGLMHDAAEAYVGDVVRPLKTQLGGYAAIERQVMRAINKKFRLIELVPDPEREERIKFADETALATEARDMFLAPPAWLSDYPPPNPKRIVPVSPDCARDAFLDRFKELTAPRGLAGAG